MDTGIEADLRAAVPVQTPELPDYLVKTYWWAYLTPASLTIFDNPLFLTFLLWGNLSKLIRTACAEFEPGQRLLQAANAYGPLSIELARVVGPGGRLEVIDIAPIQVEHVRRKLADFPQAWTRVADAAAPGNGVYDGVCCFFLLHEIPDDRKALVVDALLERIEPGSKVVFVDYHLARPWHPLRLPMGVVFRLLEPFANGLLRSEIRNFAKRADDFSWTKETCFGGLYQKVVATRLR